MRESKVEIHWPNGKCSKVGIGTDWLQQASEVGLEIPTGCLGGSCGACEIEVNGKILRACISKIPDTKSKKLKVEFAYDPYW